MKPWKPHPGIRIDRIRVSKGVAGFLFVLATVSIFAVGIPAVRPFLIASVLLGLLGGVILTYRNR